MVNDGYNMVTIPSYCGPLQNPAAVGNYLDSYETLDWDYNGIIRGVCPPTNWCRSSHPIHSATEIRDTMRREMGYEVGA